MQRRELPPIGVAEIPEGKARTQVAALCWRMRNGTPEVLLITSRETGRWVIPKGWPMKGASAAEAAMREAWEEAGVRGVVQEDCCGLYAYHKVLGSGDDVPCIVTVYPLEVAALADDFPEATQRKRRWFIPATAADLVDEPELQLLLSSFDPASL